MNLYNRHLVNTLTWPLIEMLNQRNIDQKPTPALRPLAPNSPGKLNILGHNSNPLSMNCAQVCVLEKPNKVGLSCLLESRDGAALEPKIRLEILRDFPHQSLERQLPYQQLSTLLVLPDLPKSDGPRSEPVGLLHSSGRRGRLPRRLSCQLLPWSLSSGRLASGLLSTSHGIEQKSKEKERI